MTQYNTLNVKLPNSQLNKSKSGIENATEVTFNLSSILIGNYNDEINFPHKLLLTDTQGSKIRNDFANDSAATIKFSKTHLSKMIQSGAIMTGIFGKDNSIKFLLKKTNSYLKEVSNIDTKK